MKLLLLAAYTMTFFQPFLQDMESAVNSNSYGIQWSQEAKDGIVAYAHFATSLGKAKKTPHEILCGSGVLDLNEIPSFEEVVKTGSITGKQGGEFEHFGLTASEMYQIANYIQEFKSTFTDGEKSAKLVLCDGDFAKFLANRYAEMKEEKRDDIPNPTVTTEAKNSVETPAKAAQDASTGDSPLDDEKRPKKFKTTKEIELYIEYLKNKILLARLKNNYINKNVRIPKENNPLAN